MVSGRVRVGLRLGLGVGLGAILLFIAGCRCTIPRDRVPVAGARYTTKKYSESHVFGTSENPDDPAVQHKPAALVTSN